MFWTVISLLISVTFCHPVVEMQVDYIPGNKYEGSGSFSFASYFHDHMVLQAEPQMAVIWGYAPKGTEGHHVLIAIKELQVSYVVTVDTSLTWTQRIGRIKSGGPYTITAELAGGNEVLTLKDVLFGDVWVCSGQSNMQFTMEQVFNSSSEMKDSFNYPDVRLFIVKDKTADTPLTDLNAEGIQLQWSLPTPATLESFSAVCWLYGKYLYKTLGKPLGLVETSWGGTPVEAWSSPQALSKCGLSDSKQQIMSVSDYTEFEVPTNNSVLWNAMVSPLLGMSIYGAIWYQGEANTYKNKDLYSCTFPAMIDDWRKQFSSNSGTSKLFPFGFVQLAGFNPSYSKDTGFPDIRWHQTADYGYVPNHRMRNVFMAVAMDLPDFLSPYGAIHPRDKQDVAARLVKSGLAVAYGYNISYQGPYPVMVNVTTPEPSNLPQVTIQYTMNVKQKWLDGFEVCCAFTSPPTCREGKSWWLPMATPQDSDQGNTTISFAMECKLENIMGIRYAWRDSPCNFGRCTVYGADNGLPLPPFSFSDEGFQRTFLNERAFFVKIM